MIDSKFLADYNIVVPIFEADPTDINICKYIVHKRLLSSIVYCDSIAASIDICKKLNAIEPNFARVISCNTTKTSRAIILKKYQEGKISCIVNCRILTEGFDAPITKHIVLMHMPSSKTTIIQIIGRALRLHPSKKYAQIHLPFSNREDGSDVAKFFEILAKNDARIMRSYKTKQLGGYINVVSGGSEEDLTDDFKMKYDLVYNSLGKLQNNLDIWHYHLEELKKYLNTNKKRPNQHSEIKEIKALGSWVSMQTQNAKNKTCTMKNPNIYNKWVDFITSSEYKSYFLSSSEIWYQKLAELKKYLNTNKKRPPHKSKSAQTRCLGKWTSMQLIGMKNKTWIMKNPNIYNKWVEFITSSKYCCYFKTKKNNWYQKLSDVKNYINIHKSRPSKGSKIKSIRVLGAWIGTQLLTSKEKSCIMQDPEIYSAWRDFISSEEYSPYFPNTNESTDDTADDVSGDE
jgi:superfamily II DNA/RNA helicase